MARKKKYDLEENIENKMYKVEQRVSYGPFFMSAFKTFAYTLLFFLGFLFLVFIIMWVTKK